MEWTSEQLNDLEDMGKLYLSIKECAIALEIKIDDFAIEMKNENSPAFKAYHKGVLNAKVKLIQSVNELASRGSSPAQAMAKKMIEEMDTKNLLL
jgi:hypothetical protein